GAPEDTGVLVGDVRQGSAGGRAGLHVGDVLVAVAGRPVATADDIRAALAAMNAGDSVEVQIVRDRRPATLAAIVPRAEPRAITPPRPPEGARASVEGRLEPLDRRVQRLERGGARERE